MEAAEIWDRLVCILYPPRCVLCDDVVEYDDLLCKSCRLKSEPETWRCDSGQAQVVSPLEYSGGVRHTILALKKQRDHRAMGYLAHRMCGAVRERWEFPFDRIVPVPMAPGTLRKRKFNQAGLLADALAPLLEVPVSPEFLVRLDGGRSQHTLSKEARLANAKKHFSLGDSQKAAGLRILLVDDVHTTGATIQTCADLLMQAGAAQVCGVTAAHTPDREGDTQE